MIITLRALIAAAVVTGLVVTAAIVHNCSARRPIPYIHDLDAKQPVGDAHLVEPE